MMNWWWISTWKELGEKLFLGGNEQELVNYHWNCASILHLTSLKVNSIHLFLVICHRDYDREQFADNQIPLLVIGTKLDQIHESKRHEVLTRTAFLAEDFNAEEINLVCVFTNVCLGDILVKEASYSEQSPQTQSRSGSASRCHVRVSLTSNLHTDLLEPSSYVLQIESFLRKLKKHTKSR